jgi:hypothetical protein
LPLLVKCGAIGFQFYFDGSILLTQYLNFSLRDRQLFSNYPNLFLEVLLLEAMAIFD